MAWSKFELHQLRVVPVLLVPHLQNGNYNSNDLPTGSVMVGLSESLHGSYVPKVPGMYNALSKSCWGVFFFF